VVQESRLLQRVREGIVTDVVEQRREPCRDPLLFWHGPQFLALGEGGQRRLG